MAFTCPQCKSIRDNYFMVNIPIISMGVDAYCRRGLGTSLVAGFGGAIYDRQLLRIDSGRPLIIELEYLLRRGQPMAGKVCIELGERPIRNVGSRNNRVYLLGRDHVEHGNAIADIGFNGCQAKTDHGVFAFAVLPIGAKGFDDSLSSKAGAVVWRDLFTFFGRARLCGELLSKLFRTWGRNNHDYAYLITMPQTKENPRRLCGRILSCLVDLFNARKSVPCFLGRCQDAEVSVGGP